MYVSYDMFDTCMCQMYQMSSLAKSIEKGKQFIVTCVNECSAVLEQHQQLAPEQYNNDARYRGLVSELLDTKKFAVAKMEYLLTCDPFHEKTFTAKPLRMCFRDHMGELMGRLETSPNKETAVSLCRLFGLVVQGVEDRNELGESPLVTAIADGVTDDKLELLLAAGCNVNETVDYPGGVRTAMTPLLTAALYGRTSMASVLVARGADLTAVNGNGASCVYYAAMEGHMSTVELLARLGADVNKPDNNGFTPIHMAAGNGHVNVVEVLARLGSDINKPNNDGVTPIYIAAVFGHVSVVEVLAGLGSDVNKPTNKGATPI
jgi:Ankyrin repeats (3 copies)